MRGLLDLYLNQFMVFVFVLTRISGLLMTAPIFGSQTVPLRIRAFMAIGLSLLITPLFWGREIQPVGNIVNLAVMLSVEGIIGLSLGLAVIILSGGLQLTGLIAGQMGGMQLADIADPTFNESVPVFSQFINMVALAVFVLIDGHREVMEAMLDTFRAMPPGESHLSMDVFQAISQVVSMSFVLAIRAAAPIMVSLLMAVIIMGLISRTLPQLNIIAVGFSFNSIVLLTTLSLSLGSAAWLFNRHVAHALDTVRAAITGN